MDTNTHEDATDGTGGESLGERADDGDAGAARIDPSRIDRQAAARSGVYALLATLFDEPSEAVYERLASGRIDTTCRDLIDRTGLDVDPPDLTVDDDHETLCARFNDLFTIGYAEYEDRTDGSLDSRGPPVSLYESAYRPEASWNDVNLDLARAYDYFDLEVDQSVRDNQDFLPYQLEFAGYLARLEAASSTDAARGRLDLADRHLRVVAEGIANRTGAESGAGIYGELAAFLDRFVTADQAALAERFEGGDAG